MKILFLGGNMSRGLADWLVEQGDDVIYKEDKITVDEVKQISPEMIVSYNYKYIIPKQILDCVNGNTINLHISYLPYNRGSYPNIWSFLEDTPKGVTIHYIDEGIDTGDIIVQKEVYIDEDKETLKSSYDILHKEIQTLFKENWQKIKNSEIKSKKQTGGETSTLRESLQPLNPSLEKRDGIHRSENLRNNITNADIKLRGLKNDDIHDLFNWRNHPDVRKNSFNTKPILWDKHERWFKTKINDDSNTTIYMACYQEQKIGAVRFEDIGDAIKVSVMLNPEYLGKGFGTEIIRAAVEKFISEKKINKPIIAEIKKDNIASIKAFQKANFIESYLTFVYRQ